MAEVVAEPIAPANGNEPAVGNGHEAPPEEGVASKDHLAVPGASSGKRLGAARPSSMDQGNRGEMKIVYKNLSWTVEVPNLNEATKKAQPTIKKQVLNDVSGVFRPGKLTAILGSSGAGKTTLLNVLAGYGSDGQTVGSILVNGEEIGSEFMRELSGFVHQHDIILESMTVREAVTMAAHLRLPKSMPSAEKDARVEEVLRWLSLVKCADNQIGSPEKKGISGGERRRVSVAMEMVRNPGILYLDEPTSGLDSFTAYAVAHLLQTVAHQHSRTIVATIHQPSSEIFHLFDDLVLLNLGRVIYHGPAADAMRYFDINLGYRIPRYTNPSDFIFMRILNGGGAKDVFGASTKMIRSPAASSPPAAGATVVGAVAGATADANSNSLPSSASSNSLPSFTSSKKEVASFSLDESKLKAPELATDAAAASLAAAAVQHAEGEREQKILDCWNRKNDQTGEFTEHRLAMEAEIASQSVGRSLPDRKEFTENRATFFVQFWFLCHRALNDVMRNAYKLRARLGQALFMGLFAGLCYLQVGYGQSSVQNRRGILFFVCAGGIMNSTMGTLTLFAPEKAVFKREYGSRMYSLPAFFWSKFLMELPLRIVMPFLMALIIYWMVGLQSTAAHFFIFAATLILIDIVGTSLGMLLATIFPSLPVALAASPMLLLPLMLFSGFLLNSNSIPPYFNWISYISPIKYAFIALAKNEFTSGLEFECDKAVCPYKTGDDVLRQLNFDTQPALGADEGILIALAVGFFSLAYLALWRTSKKL